MVLRGSRLLASSTILPRLTRTAQLLRLKCSAFSTLNESDEDPGAESRVYERMTQAGGASPPTATLVAPASLYLTAILE